VSDTLVFVLLFLAVGTGWWLGFREGRTRRRKAEAVRLREYMQTLARSEDAGSLTAVARALAFNIENFEAHLSLGALFRRRGELDRATAMHERLRGLAGITAEQADNADFELGRDYLAAGMLDRAERQFQGLVDRHSAFTQQALRQLLRIYEIERDWHSALNVTERLAAVEPAVNRAAAHYCCELAERDPGGSAARRLLRRALELDSYCLRARLAQVQLDLQAGGTDAAIAGLREAAALAPTLVPLMRDQLARWFARLPAGAGAGPAPEVAGLFEAADIAGADGPLGGYLCGQCGFRSRSVVWCCPGCHGWGTLAPAARGGEPVRGEQ
jgi:lipopolysaccharide biosynthesis regulator YciM